MEKQMWHLRMGSPVGSVAVSLTAQPKVSNPNFPFLYNNHFCRRIFFVVFENFMKRILITFTSTPRSTLISCYLIVFNLVTHGFQLVVPVYLLEWDHSPDHDGCTGGHPLKN